MRRLLIFQLITVFVLFFFLGIRPAFADSNFSDSFDVTYTVSDNGNTHAVFTGIIQNLTDTLYASSYVTKLGFENIGDIAASDTYGKIIPSVKKENNAQSITIPFNKYALGKGSITKFSFSFDTQDIAKHVGNIWEINIPGIANQADFSQFTAHVQVPKDFGAASYIKPQQVGSSLDFDKNTLGTSGISLAFGQNQSYAFSLTYHIKNSNIFPATPQIALPPTTNYQDVQITDITPKPKNVIQDADGNWLALYPLLPSSKLSVVVKGLAKVALVPKKETLSVESRKLYMVQQAFWDSKNQDIQKLATELRTPSNIYQYVVHHLHYDFSRIAGNQQRLGAKEALQSPDSAVCLEFTDLFIALSRAAGIAAREVDGFAYTQNPKERPLSRVKDILHTWPEYYDDALDAWIMVDPTWENTTKGTDYFNVLDFDHVAFAIKGTSSTYPISAGGYNFGPNDTSHEVSVSFGPQEVVPNPKVSLDFSITPSIFAGIPVVGNLFLLNAGQTVVASQEVSVTTPFFLPHTQKVITPPIPPFGHTVISIRFDKTGFLTKTVTPIRIQVAGNTITKNVSVSPFFLQKYFIIGGVSFAILSIIIFVAAQASGRLPFFRPKK